MKVFSVLGLREVIQDAAVAELDPPMHSSEYARRKLLLMP